MTSANVSTKVVSNKKAPKAYVIRTHKGSQQQLSYLQSILEDRGMSAGMKRKYIHTILSQYFGYIKSEGCYDLIPLYSIFCENKFGKTRAEEAILIEEGLWCIDHSYSTETHKCKKYGVPERILIEFANREVHGTSAELMYVQRKCRKKDGEKIPSVTRKVLKQHAATPCPYDYEMAKLHMETLEDMRHESKSDKCRYMQASICWRTITHDPKLIVVLNDKTWPAYIPEYSADTTTGRLAEIGFGAQGAPKALKQELFGNVLVLNLDIESCQAYGLIAILQYTNFAYDDEQFDVGPVLNALKRKDEICRNAGVTKAVFKKAFYGIIMGGCMHCRKGCEIYDQVGRFVASEVNFGSYAFMDEEVVPEMTSITMKKLRYELRDLEDLTFKFRNWLVHYFPFVNEYIPTSTRGIPFYCRKTRDGHTMLVNSLGKELDLNMFDEATAGRKAMAHLLQGLEASFIQNLTVACARHGVTVYSNQHDGLIVSELIPESVIKKSATESGFHWHKGDKHDKVYPKLVEKDFVDTIQYEVA